MTDSPLTYPRPQGQPGQPLSPSSPPVNGQQPPPKRPRIDTNNWGPVTNSAYGPPQFKTPSAYPSATSPYASFNSPEPYTQTPTIVEPPKSATGSMGPPEKPKNDNKATDINSLTDIFSAAGVDLRAEEDYLSQAYNHNSQQPNPSFATSFGSTPNSSQTISPESTFAQWTQSGNASGLAQAARPVGPLSQPTISASDLQNMVEAKLRTHATEHSKHLRDPFLHSGALRQRISNIANKSHCRFRPEGIQPAEGRSATPSVAFSQKPLPDGSSLVDVKVDVSVRTILESSPLVPVLALLSLAAKDRMRNVMEDAYMTSRSRAYGGTVPPDWADIAKGTGPSEKVQAKQENISGTPWEAPINAGSPKATVPAKRMPFQASFFTC